MTGRERTCRKLTAGLFMGLRSGSRRNFLKTMSGAVMFPSLCNASLDWNSFFSPASQSPSAFAFEEIPVASSGISWTHVSGRSPMAHLPETVGAGCAFIDYDNDGWPDIYVACDSTPSILYRNNGDGTFTDIAVVAGAAFNEDGREQAGMGSTIGDYNGDGRPDIFKTNFYEFFQNYI